MIKLTDILNEDCWKGYKQIGMKTKNGKEVPNCVPESVEENQWSSVEQKMVNQILRMKKGEMKVYELPSKTQKFYFKNKKKFESINEASLTISIANIVRELFPQEFFWAYTPKDTERVKAVISDLVRTLNRFYKQHNIKVRFTDTSYKMKMYSKESVNENLSSSERLEHMKLLNRAMRLMPGSQKQKDIIKQLNVLRIKGGMAPLKEDLRKWFGKGKTGSATGGGWDRYNTQGEKVGKCGDAKEGEPYAACLSQEKAKKLGKDGIAAFVKRKRAAQSKAGDAKKGGEQKKGQKPTYVKTGA